MIAVVDAGLGNLRSVAKALEATGTLQPVRVTSDPAARTSGMTRIISQRIAPSPSRKRSYPRTDNPCMRSRARQIMPRSRTITCSALNFLKRPILICPCMRSRTADASGVPGAIECVR